jgi:phosphohistidine phosphatase
MITRHLALIRHAVAVPQVEGEPDFSRSLTSGGRETSSAMGKYLEKQSDFRPEVIITSPAPRALETAQLVGAPLGFPPDPIDEDRRIYDATWDELAEVVRGLPNSRHFVALAGHNPGFKDFTAWLLGQPDFKFPKGAVTWIELDAKGWADVRKGSGRLRQFWKPRDLGIG